MRARAIGKAICGGLAVGIAAAATGVLRWNLDTRRRVARLRGAAKTAELPFSPAEVADLPAPVVRYFEFALTPGQSLARGARLRQVGEFAMRPNAWRPFTAVEYFSVHPPAFLWDARIQFAPLVSMYVRDGYAAGEGALNARLAALVPLADVHGSPEIASGELLRYLAEGPWLPAALLPRYGTTWEPIDENNARATLVDGATAVSCAMRFGERGEIEQITAMRGRDVNGTSVSTPWVGRWHDYGRVDGMMIPLSGEVEWLMPAGPFPYWRGRIVESRYEFET